MSENYLVVPIDVAALAVSQADVEAGAQGLAPTVDFSRLPSIRGAGPYTSDVVLDKATPFADDATQPLLAGIHLHWSLPRQLTRGNAGTKGLEFLSVPDRWLVTRILVQNTPSSPAPPPLRSWVVESDRLGTRRRGREPSILMPQEGQAALIRWLGRTVAAARWLESGNSVPRAPRPFTALGYGDPSFAAYYPNCVSVFGFHDSLKDLERYAPGDFILSYQVSGWYARPEAHDPLQRIPAATLFGVNEDVNRLVCNGVVDGIDWQPTRRYLKPSDQPLAVALANTTREALSALLAGGNPTAQLSLNSLQFGLLSAADNHDTSIRDFEQDVHEAGFISLPGGATWSIEPADGKDRAGDMPPISPGQVQALAQLNALQATKDKDKRDCQARQAQLFEHWHKYQQIERPSRRVRQMTLWLSRESEAVIRLRIALARQQITIRRLAHNLRGQLPGDLTLAQRTAAPRFYQPTEPVLMLAGEDVRAPARHAPDTLGHDPEQCRSGSRLINAITLNGTGAGDAAITLGAKDLPQPRLHDALPEAGILRALVAEALLIGKACQSLVADALLAKAPSRSREDILNHLQNSLVKLPGDSAAPLYYHGLAPQTNYRRPWLDTPWLPFLLQYEISAAAVEPKGDEYPAEFIRERFAFSSDSIDLTYPGSTLGRARSYCASVLLAANATLGLKAEIERYREASKTLDTSLETLVQRLDRLPLLAQSMSGFNDALLMRRATLQMPVEDPRARVGLRRLMARVSRAVGDQNRFTPRAGDDFRPLRAEGLNILRLRLVDIFGRFKDYPQPKPWIATGITPPLALQGKHAAFLPPRITQPARLQFRWQAADKTVVDGSPVLGWIMPSHLADAAMIYAANGKALGEVALEGSRSRWINSPTGGHDYAAPLETVLAGQPTDLAQLLRRLCSDDTNFLSDFLRQVEHALRYCLPDRFAETAEQVVLSGQPLVLARASLSLELAGPALQSQSWESLDKTLQDASASNDGGLGTVRFPVRLGALNQIDDSLVGYWIAPHQPDDYKDFLAPHGGAGNPPLSSDALTLVADGKPQDVLLLLDPRGSVHASSGILPVKNLDLPPRYYVDALNALDVTFDCFPVLTGTGPSLPMSMVLPGTPNATWRWTSNLGSEWSSMTPEQINVAKARLDHSTQSIAEGWLSMRREGQKKADNT